MKGIFLFRFTHPWCHPNCLSFSVEMPYAGDALTTTLLIRVKGRFSMVVMLRGNHPPVPTCLVQKKPDLFSSKGFLRPAAHECVLRCVSIPNFHSVSDRCWSPISYFVRSTRVSLSIWVQPNAPIFLYKESIAADLLNCKHSHNNSYHWPSHVVS